MRFIRWIFRLFRFLLIYFVVSTIVIVGFATLGPGLWSPPIIRNLERIAQEKLDTKLRIGNVHFVRFWPITMRFGDMEIEKNPARTTGTVKAVDLSWALRRVDKNWLRPKIVLAVALVEPKLKYSPPPERPGSQGANDAAGGGSYVAVFNPSLLGRPKIADFDISFAVYRGEFASTDPKSPSATAVNFLIQIPSLRAAQWEPLVNFDAIAQTSVGALPLVLPIELKLYPTLITDTEWLVNNVKLSVAKLEFVGKGFYAWNGNYDFKLDLKSTDLKKIPPSFLPPGQWNGEFQGDLRFDRQSGAPPRIAVSVESQNLQGQVNWKVQEGSLEGDVSAQTRVKLVYAETLTMDDSTINFDMTKATAHYGEWLKKEKGVDMSLNIVGDAINQKINLRRAQLRLAQLRLDASGDAPMAGNGRGKVVVNMPPTSLMGLERIFPPLEKSPIQGIVSMDAEGIGQFGDFKNWDFELKDLSVKGLRGRLDFGFGALTVQGPMSGQASFRARLKGATLESLNWDVISDLTYLDVVYGHQFRKSSGFNLKMYSLGKSLGNQYAIDKMRLVGDIGDLTAKGSFSVGNYEYPMSLNLSMTPLNVRNALDLAKVKNLKMLGQITGAVAVNGKYIPKEGIATTPLQVTGRLALKDGFLEYHSPPAPPKKAGEKSSSTMSTVVDPLLPNYSIIRTANFSVNSTFKQIIFDDVKMDGVTHVGQWQMGQWKGSGVIKDLWQGQVEVNELVLSPMASPPSIDVKIVMSDIHAGPALEWVKPKMKGYLVGKASGTVNVLGAIPTQAIGFSQIRADGKIDLKEAELKTVNLDEMINKELKKLGAGSNSVKNQPLPFVGRSEFIFQDSQVNLEKLQIVTGRRDELNLRGIVYEDTAIALSGQLGLASVRLGGAIGQANTDSQGRLVVPMQIKGTLLKPEFAITDTTIKKMLTKTLEKEAGKYFKKLLGK